MKKTLLAAAVLVAACTGSPSSTTAPTAAFSAAPTATMAAAPTATPATPVPTQSPTQEPEPTLGNEFPRTVTDDEGTDVTIEALPERFVFKDPANTEIVLTMGTEGTLVGGTDSDD